MVNWGKQKFTVQRGYQWFAIIGMPFLIVRELQRLLISLDVNVSVVILYLIGAIIIYVVGYVDAKITLRSEQDYVSRRNPMLKEILDKIEEKKTEENKK